MTFLFAAKTPEPFLQIVLTFFWLKKDGFSGHYNEFDANFSLCKIIKNARGVSGSRSVKHKFHVDQVNFLDKEMMMTLTEILAKLVYLSTNPWPNFHSFLVLFLTNFRSNFDLFLNQF